MLYSRWFALVGVLLGLTWIIQAILLIWLTQDTELQLLAIDTILNDPAVFILLGILFLLLGIILIASTWKKFKKKSIDISCTPSKAIEVESVLLENGVNRICQKLFPNQTIKCSIQLSKDFLTVGINVGDFNETMIPILEKEMQHFFSSCGIRQQVELKLFTTSSSNRANEL